MKIGFIGCGNMGSAMIGGILKKGVFEKKEIIVSNLTEEGSRQKQGKTWGCHDYGQLRSCEKCKYCYISSEAAIL